MDAPTLPESSASSFRNVSGVREGREHEDITNGIRGIVANVTGRWVTFVYNDANIITLPVQIFRRRFRICKSQ